MPTYVYECDAGHEFERVQRITEDALTTCDVAVMKHNETDFVTAGCGAPCRRVIQAPGIVLKGSGWARDGYSDYTPASEANPRHKKGRR